MYRSCLLTIAIKSMLMSLIKSQFQIVSTTLPVRMEQFCAGEYNGILTVVNGYGNEENYLSAFSTPSALTNHYWLTHTDINMVQDSKGYFYQQPCVQYNELLLGAPAQLYTNPLLVIFNLTEIKYLPLEQYDSTLLQPVDSSCMTVSNHQLFIIGGIKLTISTTNATNIVQSYNIINNTWTLKSSMSVARTHHGCVNIDNHIYALGGVTTPKTEYNAKSIEKYFVDTDEWLLLNVTLLKGIAYHQCVYITSYIYCMGGLYYPSVSYDDLSTTNIIIFDPGNDIIFHTSNIQLNNARIFHSVITTELDDILILGGECNQFKCP
eukprot:62466_1